MKKILLLCIVLMQWSCNSDDYGQQNCTEEFVYGLSVTVRDAITNEILTDDVSVIARDGNYQEALMRIEGEGPFFGAGERPGNYTIEITVANYQSFISEVISVELTRDECHVETEILEFDLIPN